MTPAHVVKIQTAQGPKFKALDGQGNMIHTPHWNEGMVQEFADGWNAAVDAITTKAIALVTDLNKMGGTP